MQRLSKADESFNQNISTIFEIASKSHELFKSSDIEEKRRIIAMLFYELINEWRQASVYNASALLYVLKFDGSSRMALGRN